ncbi:GNAT family N-acetyltransferase [Celerinatantimonas sp. MCCC 1A17872]|uniref:GNAT family N-acetyltransferase n=1 Tax=Celerinatantimonas sp. MCCC 1A17872 TaxID=3177514 RepID=UPI0038C0D780
MLHIPKLVSERAITTILRSEQSPLLANFYARNQTFFKPWFPTRPSYYFSDDYWRGRLDQIYKAFLSDEAIYFCALSLDEQQVLAVANFTAIQEGAFKGCQLHFALDEANQGQGLMLEILSHSLNFVFCELDLHRVSCCYPPRNKRAHNLLKHLGFEQEGFARSYLRLDGRWQDHHLASLINPLHDSHFF